MDDGYTTAFEYAINEYKRLKMRHSLALHDYCLKVKERAEHYVRATKLPIETIKMSVEGDCAEEHHRANLLQADAEAARARMIAIALSGGGYVHNQCPHTAKRPVCHHGGDETERIPAADI